MDISDAIWIHLNNYKNQHLDGLKPYPTDIVIP